MSGLRLVQLLNQQAVVVGGLVPKGAYSGATAYAIGDSVSYNGSSYVALAATTGNLPTTTAFWQLLASGITGSPDKNFIYPFTSLASITVTHNLAKYPAVTVVDTSGDECEGDVIHVSVNQLTISFSSSFSGTVFCN